MWGLSRRLLRPRSLPQAQLVGISIVRQQSHPLSSFSVESDPFARPPSEKQLSYAAALAEKHGAIIP